MLEILHKEEPEVTEFLSLVREESPFNYAMLFAGDRWYLVEWVALFKVNGQPVGVATLSPTDEMAQNGPHVIGGYVLAEHRNQGIGSQLLKALAEESLTLYGKGITVDATNVTAWNSARSVAEITDLVSVNKCFF